jgi:hypothetical protein
MVKIPADLTIYGDLFLGLGNELLMVLFFSAAHAARPFRSASSPLHGDSLRDRFFLLVVSAFFDFTHGDFQHSFCDIERFDRVLDLLSIDHVSIEMARVVKSAQ